MSKFVVGNWKSNKLQSEVESWMKVALESRAIETLKHITPIICAPALYLPLLSKKIPGLSLGAQAVSPYGNGAYTGAISALQLAQYVQYALLGHAERRRYFGETDQIVAQQVRQALDADITPIVAVDDANWVSQLMLFTKQERTKVLVMYEPPEAISAQVGAQPVPVSDVVRAIEEIRTQLRPKAVLYGGSVSPANVGEYLQRPEIDGVVPGAASLEVSTFLELLRHADMAAALPPS